MATTASHSNLHAKSFTGLGSQGDLFDSAHYGTYDTGIGSMTSHPYQHQTNSQNHSSFSNGYQNSSYPAQRSEIYPYERDENHNEASDRDLPNSHSQKFNDRSTFVGVDDKKMQKTGKQQQQQLPSNNPSEGKPSDHTTAKSKSTTLPSIGQPTPSTSERPTRQISNPTIDPRMNKSTQMRKNAIKQKGEVLEQKRRNGNFPADRKDSADSKKKRRNNKESHSVPKQRRSHRKSRLTDDSASSNDEDEQPLETNHQSSKKKNQNLPPLRRLPLPAPPPFFDPYSYPHLGYPPGRHPYYDPYYGYPYPPARFDRRTRHFYENPEYDSYDATFDFHKNQARTKLKSRASKKRDDGHTTDREVHSADEAEHGGEGRKSRKRGEDPLLVDPYFGEGHALEVWRQNRNEYLKNKFKPSVHDVLYSQQWKKADSYLENQRRRAVRETQGFYYPYKQYTLKDYKDLQKSETNKNPYAPMEEPLTERKSRLRKPKSYGFNQKESEQNQRAPHRLEPLNQQNGEINEKSSKRQRALEYAKIQVSRNHPTKENRVKTDPTEEYVNSLFPTNDDDDDERENHVNERQRENQRRHPYEYENDE